MPSPPWEALKGQVQWGFSGPPTVIPPAPLSVLILPDLLQQFEHPFDNPHRGVNFKIARPGPPCLVTAKSVVFWSRKIAVVAVGQRGRERSGKRTFLFDFKPDLDEDLARNGVNRQIADSQGLQN